EVRRARWLPADALVDLMRPHLSPSMLRAYEDGHIQPPDDFLNDFVRLLSDPRFDFDADAQTLLKARLGILTVEALPEASPSVNSIRDLLTNLNGKKFHEALQIVQDALAINDFSASQMVLRPQKNMMRANEALYLDWKAGKKKPNADVPKRVADNSRF